MRKESSMEFGAMVNEVAKLYSEKFDRASKSRIGISLAQYRLLATLDTHEGAEPIKQVELATRMDMSPMGVVGLCQRMEKNGWIRRAGSDTDLRVKHVTLEAKGDSALDALLGFGNAQADEALGSLSASERTQLLALLGKVHARLRSVTAGA